MLGLVWLGCVSEGRRVGCQVYSAKDARDGNGYIVRGNAVGVKNTVFFEDEKSELQVEEAEAMT